MKAIEARRQELEDLRRTLAEQRARLRVACDAACERGGTILVDPARLAELEETCAARAPSGNTSPLEGTGGPWIRC
jgi:hypothetical protein